MKISEYLHQLSKYKVDYTYQRPANVWTMKDKKCFIDTILRKEPVPLIFLNKNTKEDVFYIVDGQQRLSCIKDFFNNKFPLSKEFSETQYDGKYYKDLSTTDQQKFLSYDIKTHIVKNYNDDRVRMIFSRLQRGKQLRLGERLNAQPGKFIEVVREIFNNDFFKNSIADKQRQGYKMYPVISRMIYYEFYSVKESTPDRIYEIYEDKKDISKDCKEVKKVVKTLNYLNKVFPSHNEGLYVFTSDAWILAVYMMISKLLEGYSLLGLENQISSFLRDFWKSIYDRDERMSNSQYIDFYDRIRGGWSETNNTTRRDTLVEMFLEEEVVLVLDDRRQISNEEKINIFAKNNHCERCNKEISKYTEGQFHHRIRWIDGGKTSADNIAFLCNECHVEIHKDKKIESVVFEIEDQDEF